MYGGSEEVTIEEASHWYFSGPAKLQEPRELAWRLQPARLQDGPVSPNWVYSRDRSKPYYPNIQNHRILFAADAARRVR